MLCPDRPNNGVLHKCFTVNDACFTSGSFDNVSMHSNLSGTSSVMGRLHLNDYVIRLCVDLLSSLILVKPQSAWWAVCWGGKDSYWQMAVAVVSGDSCPSEGLLFPRRYCYTNKSTRDATSKIMHGTWRCVIHLLECVDAVPFPSRLVQARQARIHFVVWK